MAGAASGQILSLVATVIWSLIGLGVAAAVARQPKSAVSGIFAGVAAGMVVGFAPPFLFGYLGMIVPWGQMEFWLATLWYRLFGG